jgi:cation diffusion facilitator family transporter
VAVYRIRSGKRNCSAALVADGYHARVVGFTSLAVVLGVAGVAAGFELADPIVGIAISLVILRIVAQSPRTVGLRATESRPGPSETIARSARRVEGIRDVAEVRARWHGHGIKTELTIDVAAAATVADAHQIAGAVRHQLAHDIDHITDLAIERGRRT